MDTLRSYWPECKGGCGDVLIDTCFPQSIMVYCQKCLGVNVFRNSTEAVEFLSLTDYRDAARLGHYTDSEKKRLSAVVQWAEAGCPALLPLLRKADYNSHTEKQPDTRKGSASENYSGCAVPTSST